MTWNEIALSIFAPGKAGFPVLCILVLSVVSWLWGLIAKAANQGFSASLMDTLVKFISISLVAGAVLGTIKVVGKMTGIN